MDDYLKFDKQQKKKHKVDYTTLCENKISLANKLAKFDGKFKEAIEILFDLEKQTRKAANLASSSRVLVAIVQICFEASEWNALNENIALLMKKTSQLKQSVCKMIQECLTYIDKAPDTEQKLRLIETLRRVTKGRIYVEVEHARLTKMLADIKEANGDIDGATSIMHELQIEAYGTMGKRERVELLLEQMRLWLAKDDHLRCQVIANKINKKFFDDAENDDLKVKYYNLMIELDRNSSYLKTSRHCQAIINSDLIKNIPKRRENMIISAVMYCILSSYGNEQQDMMHKLIQSEFTKEIPVYIKILSLFLNKELINTDEFYKTYGKELRSSQLFDQETIHGKKCWNDLADRIIEHNIQIISIYYTKIYLKRMGELLDLPVEKCEEYLSKLLNLGVIHVKIDRILGIVSFVPKTSSSSILNAWSSDTRELMNMICNTRHLIHREEVVKKALIS